MGSPGEAAYEAWRKLCFWDTPWYALCAEAKARWEIIALSAVQWRPAR